MATEAPKKPENAEAEEGAAPAKPRRKFALGKLFSVKGLAVLLAVSVTGHALGYAWTHRGRETVTPTWEVTLGKFVFHPSPVANPSIAGATFELHISLIDPRDTQVVASLTARRLKLQQDIEELLRQAHGDDFADPQLHELKRQLAEQINATLGVRAVEHVIITDLVLEHPAAPVFSQPEAPDTQPAGSRTARHLLQ